MNLIIFCTSVQNLLLKFLDLYNSPGDRKRKLYYKKKIKTKYLNQKQL